LLLDRYRSLFALPHVPRLVAASLIVRLNFGLPLAIVLLVREATGSYALAGAAAAASSATFAIVSPIRGRLVDRLNPARVLVPMAFGLAAVLGLLVFAALAGAPGWVLVAIAALSGCTHPPLVASMRTLWAWLTPSEDAAQAAYSLEAVLTEVGAIAGPLLVAAIVTLWSPEAATVTMAVLMLAGNLLFASAAPAREWRGAERTVGRLGPLVSPVMRAVVISNIPFGAAVVALDIAAPAFAEEHGSASFGGVLLAALAAGSLVGGLWYGTWKPPAGRATRRYALLCGLLALGFAPLALATSNAALVPLMALAGFGFAPASAAASQVIDEHAPAGTGTEAWTWIISAYMAGAAIGGAAAGVVVEELGVRAGLLVASVVTALGALYALAKLRNVSVERTPA
jgi:predicted MFS family arabinose efflux permease